MDEKTCKAKKMRKLGKLRINKIWAQNICIAVFAELDLLLEHFKGIVHNFFVYRSNLIFWIVTGCGIADFGRRGQ